LRITSEKKLGRMQITDVSLFEMGLIPSKPGVPVSTSDTPDQTAEKSELSLETLTHGLIDARSSQLKSAKVGVGARLCASSKSGPLQPVSPDRISNVTVQVFLRT
jgi:hypothetical protein